MHFTYFNYYCRDIDIKSTIIFRRKATLFWNKHHDKLQLWILNQCFSNWFKSCWNVSGVTILRNICITFVEFNKLMKILLVKHSPTAFVVSECLNGPSTNRCFTFHNHKLLWNQNCCSPLEIREYFLELNNCFELYK